MSVPFYSQHSKLSLVVLQQERSHKGGHDLTLNTHRNKRTSNTNRCLPKLDLIEEPQKLYYAIILLRFLRFGQFSILQELCQIINVVYYQFYHLPCFFDKFCNKKNCNSISVIEENRILLSGIIKHIRKLLQSNVLCS